jgi:hypothetical protein
MIQELGDQADPELARTLTSGLDFPVQVYEHVRLNPAVAADADSFLIRFPSHRRDKMRETFRPDPGGPHVDGLEDPEVRPIHRAPVFLYQTICDPVVTLSTRPGSCPDRIVLPGNDFR